ncbi:hypothetical protein BDZ89DRAFT_1044666 [Hymenopellis radicata]|nr:hypothetical protein BDZ89DRAFT_1044666 [Hymenopellis radicata]
MSPSGGGTIVKFVKNGHLDFGENYVQELEDKRNSNKAKTLAAIPNLHTIQTLTSAKAASALNKALPPTRAAPLNVLIQVNTSGEDAKSGLAPLSTASPSGALTTSQSSSSQSVPPASAGPDDHRDFEAALKAGSDIVRVGTGIFGGRKTKAEVVAQK